MISDSLDLRSTFSGSTKWKYISVVYITHDDVAIFCFDFSWSYGQIRAVVVILISSSEV